MSHSRHKPECPPPNSGASPPRTFVLTSTCLYPFPTASLPSLVNPKSIESLTGSGKVLSVFHSIVLKVEEKGISSRVERTKKMLTATIVHLCGSLYLCELFHFHGPLYLRGALSLLCGPFTHTTFHYHMQWRRQDVRQVIFSGH